MTQTGQLLQVRRAHDIFLRQLAAILTTLADLAERTKDVLLPGRTHGQHALPATFGFKVAVWIDELGRHVERLQGCEGRVFVAMLGGGAGTLASLGELGLATQERMAALLGLRSMPMPARTIGDHQAEYVTLLGMLASTCSKIGREIYTLMKQEFGEVEEPVPPGTVGSSTMPQKRNPKLSQDIIAAAAQIRALVPLALEAMQTEHEADRTTSIMMSRALVQACELTGDMLQRMMVLLDGLQVFPDRMRENLDLSGRPDHGRGAHARAGPADRPPAGARHRVRRRAGLGDPVAPIPRDAGEGSARERGAHACAGGGPAGPRALHRPLPSVRRARGRDGPRDRSRDRAPEAVKITRFLAAIGLAVLVILISLPSEGQAPKSGGWLNLRLREDLPVGFAIHESPTISTMWPAMPCLSNLVLFDPLKPVHSVDTIVGELAERWSWQENYHKLVFFLRSDVKWHDGKPFTSKDVKHTFDMIRETPDAPAKLRLNPRREWYANVEAVEAPDPRTVVFRLTRPQPSLLLMLASGFTPIYAAHVPAAAYRSGCVGTGPFKVKEWRKGEFVEYVKNPDYFVKGRPYLDGLRYLMIAERGTATAALQTGRVDVAFPGETPKGIADQLKSTVPRLVITTINTSVVDHLIFNTKKPPFDNAKLRQAVTRAIDRRAYIAAVYLGGAAHGSTLASKPYGVWGIGERELRALPGSRRARRRAGEGQRLCWQRRDTVPTGP